jgi:hypothetical protein
MNPHRLIVAAIIGLGLAVVVLQARHQEPSVAHGIVIDAATRQPLAGAFVGWRTGVKQIQMIGVLTDAEGRFSAPLAEDVVSAYVRMKGYEVTSFALQPPAGATLELPVRVAAPMRGRVLDTAGLPVRKGIVRFVSMQPGGLHPLIQASTREDGSYEVDGLRSDGLYSVEIETPGCASVRVRQDTGRSLVDAGVRTDRLPRCK